MKAIIQAYSPEEAERIARGEQTVKVCKTAPKDTPFKVYMYCTKQKVNGEILLTYDKKIEGRNRGFRNNGDIPIAGKVIGEFVCDKVEQYEANERGWYIYPQDEVYMWTDEIAGYGKGKLLSGLHISELKIYDEPKELSEFSRYGYKKIEHKGSGYVFCDNTQCRYCEPDEVIAGVYRPPVCRKGGCKITRPPQSWQYVEPLTK